MSEPDYVHVYKPEISILGNWLRLPNLYIKAETYFDDIDEHDIAKYIKKTYSKDYLKQLVIDAIESGEIPIDVFIGDTDAYPIEDFKEDEYITLEEFNKTLNK